MLRVFFIRSNDGFNWVDWLLALVYLIYNYCYNCTSIVFRRVILNSLHLPPQMWSLFKSILIVKTSVLKQTNETYQFYNIDTRKHIFVIAEPRLKPISIFFCSYHSIKLIMYFTIRDFNQKTLQVYYIYINYR